VPSVPLDLAVAKFWILSVVKSVADSLWRWPQYAPVVIYVCWLISDSCWPLLCIVMQVKWLEENCKAKTNIKPQVDRSVGNAVRVRPTHSILKLWW
jgi:hypothetical protein